MTGFAENLLDFCKAKAWRIATAESCTGGLISAALTGVPGSSSVFDRGFAAYSNQAKHEMLGVPEALFITHGAVSQDVALAMRAGVSAQSHAEITIAVTGVAGPGGTPQKPEGMVWFAFASPEIKPHGVLQNFGAIGRDAVRQRSVEFALSYALQMHK